MATWRQIERTLPRRVRLHRLITRMANHGTTTVSSQARFNRVLTEWARCVENDVIKYEPWRAAEETARWNAEHRTT